jgi:hypothetical protein
MPGPASTILTKSGAALIAAAPARTKKSPRAWGREFRGFMALGAYFEVLFLDVKDMKFREY